MANPRTPPRRPPGRPRSEGARRAILEAAYHLLRKGGIASASSDDIAKAAGVSKATLYRWWKTKEAIMLDAFFEKMTPVLPYEAKGSPLQALRENVVRGAAWLNSEDGRLAVRIISEVYEDPKMSRLFLEHFYLPRRALQIRLVKKAIEAGELRPDTDPEILVDALQGPLYFRFQIGHAPVDRKFASKLVDQVLRAVTS
jgi:AcrR family transcriptional regulator